MHFSVILLFFFFSFFISLCQFFFSILALSQYYESISYRSSFLFLFFFQLYSHIIYNSFWLLLKLYVPEVEHDERHFFWRKKNKTPICCLNSLCRTLLQSTVLWISETMKNYFLWFVLDWKMASFIHFSIPQANYNF